MFISGMKNVSPKSFQTQPGQVGQQLTVACWLTLIHSLTAHSRIIFHLIKTAIKTIVNFIHYPIQKKRNIPNFDVTPLKRFCWKIKKWHRRIGAWRRAKSWRCFHFITKIHVLLKWKGEDGLSKPAAFILFYAAFLKLVLLHLISG